MMYIYLTFAFESRTPTSRGAKLKYVFPTNHKTGTANNTKVKVHQGAIFYKRNACTPITFLKAGN